MKGSRLVIRQNIVDVHSIGSRATSNLFRAK